MNPLRAILPGGFRDIAANLILHVFEPESASAVRQPPTLQHSINHILDEMELIALEKHAVKDTADVSRILKTERGELEEDGDFSLGKPATGDQSSEPGALQKIVGGKLVAAEARRIARQFSIEPAEPHVHGVPRTSAA